MASRNNSTFSYTLARKPNGQALRSEMTHGRLQWFFCLVGYHGSRRIIEKLFSVDKDNPDDNRLDGYVYECERCKRTFVSLP